VVSHSGFLRTGVTGHWFSNADYRVFDFEERKDSSEPTRLKLREETRSGGLGQSWTHTVVLGEGLPEDTE